MIQIEDLRDIYEGQTGVLVGNGPSLAKVPVEFLNLYPTMGMNRIPEWALKHWAPNLYCCIGYDQFNTKAKRDTMRPIVELSRFSFLNRMFTYDFRYDNVFSILGHSSYKLKKGNTEFSEDPLRTVGVGGTMAYVALQLMYFLGFTTVLCVGIDGTYSKDWHWFKESKFPDFKSGPGPAYNHDDGMWNTAASRTLNLARFYYADNNREIINLTPNSKFTMFETDDLKNWYSGQNKTTLIESRKMGLQES